MFVECMANEVVLCHHYQSTCTVHGDLENVVFNFPTSAALKGILEKGTLIIPHPSQGELIPTKV